MDLETKPKEQKTKMPVLVCLILTLITLATIFLGYYYKNPFIIILGILPTGIYEAIRTEGYYTKAGSVLIMVLVILEILAIKGFLKFNLANWSGQTEVYFGGYFLPLGDITFIFPAVAAIISLVLFFRTYGLYTKWLSILLLLSAASLLYLVNKESFFEFLKTQRYYL